MFGSFHSVRVGEPIRHEAISVFPLFVDSAGSVPYLLSHEAIQTKSVVVEEVDEGGSVPELVVENKGDVQVLFIEGEELVGAKQNRILNTSLLVGPGSKLRIPVSCVEQGRWRYRTRHFGSSGSHSPSKLRYALKKSVAATLKKEGSYQSDQAEVWKQVKMLHAEHGTDSSTAAMSDAFAARKDKVSDLQRRFDYVDGAYGIAVAINARVVAVDLFDQPSTCRKVWSRLLTGFLMDSLIEATGSRSAEIADVEDLISKVQNADWSKVDTVGEGVEYRSEFADEHGSALTFDEELVHGSVLAGP